MNYPAELDFMGDGLSDDEKDILGWVDSRLFSKEKFLASNWVRTLARGCEGCIRAGYSGADSGTRD